MNKFFLVFIFLTSFSSTSFAEHCKTNEAWEILEAKYIVTNTINGLTGKDTNSLYAQDGDETFWIGSYESKLGLKQRIFLTGKVEIRLRCQETFIAQNRTIEFPLNAKVSFSGLIARLAFIRNARMAIDGLKNVKLSDLMNMNLTGGKAAITIGVVFGLNPNGMILRNNKFGVTIRDAETTLASIFGVGVHFSYADFSFTTDQAQLHNEKITITSWSGEQKDGNTLKEIKLQDALDIKF